MIYIIYIYIGPALAIENLIEWSALDAHDYPLIAHVAWNALAVPISSGPSERVSSQSVLVMTQRRSRLKSERPETPMLLRGLGGTVEKFT